MVGFEDLAYTTYLIILETASTMSSPPSYFLDTSLNEDEIARIFSSSDTDALFCAFGTAWSTRFVHDCPVVLLSLIQLQTDNGYQAKHQIYREGLFRFLFSKPQGTSKNYLLTGKHFSQSWERAFLLTFDASTHSKRTVKSCQYHP